MSENQIFPNLPLPEEVGINLEKRARDLGIKYLLPSICSLSMGGRGPIIPVSAIKDVACNGYNFHGFADFGTGAEEPEFYCVPDPKTLVQLPWKPQYGWMASNIYMKGKISPLCPRTNLIRQLQKLKDAGYVLKTGMEPEFFILDKDALKEGTTLDKAPGTRYHDPLLELHHADVLTKIIDVLDELGWQPFQVEKEAASAQYEVNYGYGDALETADRMVFFKFMVKEIAREAGLRISFMPFVPQFLIGNGQHIHQSLWDVKTDKNVMHGEGELGFSDVGRHWLAGVLNHLEGMTAVACPVINSYKRLHGMKNLSNFTAYGVDSRYVPLRIVQKNGKSDRIEYRTPDSSVNPYFIHAALVVAGLDGLTKGEDPDPKLRSEEALWGESTPKHCKTMPQTLDFAIQALEADEVLTAGLGEEFVGAFHKAKEFEAQAHRKELTQAEIVLVDIY